MENSQTKIKNRILKTCYNIVKNIKWPLILDGMNTGRQMMIVKYNSTLRKACLRNGWDTFIDKLLINDNPKILKVTYKNISIIKDWVF